MKRNVARCKPSSCRESVCLPGGPGSSHQAQKCQQAKLTGIGIGREKRFWRFVIDKSATVEARAQNRNVQSRPGQPGNDEGGFLKHFAEFRPEGWLLLALDLTRFGAFSVCVWLLRFAFLAWRAERSKLIHTLPIHCWTTRHRTYICKLFLTNKTHLRLALPIFNPHRPGPAHFGKLALGTNNSSCSTNKRRHPSWTARQY